MGDKSNGISVAQTSHEVFVRVAGRGTFQNSQPLKRYALEMIQRGSDEFVVDLRECLSMDSTFLGVLAGIGLRLKQTAGGCVHVVNISDRNMEVVRTLGLDRLFCMDIHAGDHEGSPLPADDAFQPLSAVTASPVAPAPDKTQMASDMLAAHENLIRVDERNEPRFRDVTQLLRDQARPPGPQEKKTEPSKPKPSEPTQ